MQIHIRGHSCMHAGTDLKEKKKSPACQSAQINVKSYNAYPAIHYH